MIRLHTPPVRVALVLALSASALLIALPASAQGKRVRGVETSLLPNDAFASSLEDNGYVLNVVAPGAARAPYIAFPITSGRVSVIRGRVVRGFVNHAGGLAFTRDGLASSVTNFKLILGRRTFLGARIGVNRVKFLNLTGATARRSATRIVITADAGLSTEGAIALNRAFSTTNFNTDQPVGRVTVEIR